MRGERPNEGRYARESTEGRSVHRYKKRIQKSGDFVTRSPIVMERSMDDNDKVCFHYRCGSKI